MATTVDTNRLRTLLDDGAQLVDVLPAETFRQEPLPGAVNIPRRSSACTPRSSPTPQPPQR
jgi:rhodanese-related sulfurtransferase